jgi:hypothetical protein
LIYLATKDIPQDIAVAKLCFDLSSNPSMVSITLTAHVLNQEKQPSLSNRHTNFADFRSLARETFTLNISLKTEDDNKTAVKIFSVTLQWVHWDGKSEHSESLKNTTVILTN